MAESLPGRLFVRATEMLDRAVGWHRLPTPLGLVVLIGLRRRLRQRNLYDTSPPSSPAPAAGAGGGNHAGGPTTRTADGTGNDLSCPMMGSAGARFGRNVPLRHTYPEPEPAILEPNPRVVSRELLARREFVPATTLNVLAAAWLQFMIRDWFSHGASPKENPWRLPLAEDDPWPERPMRIFRTAPDGNRSPEEADAPPTYRNVHSHWWDGSQIYGSDGETQARARSGEDGKLAIGADGLIPVDPATGKHPADEPGFWLGIAMMHSLFTLEHNAICDRLRAEYPTWSDEDLFGRARLVNAALIAKIHTVEWTTALLGHPTMQIGMRANWWGLAGERVSRLVGRLGGSEVLSGIPGSATNHFGVPYALTEEFVAVYRMHPLIPDDYEFRSVADGRYLQGCVFREVANRGALERLDEVAMPDLFYSFGVAHPGAITLHNYPTGLQNYERPDGFRQDLAATDVLRTREQGVPRYNEFRRLLHLRPARTFEELTPNREWAGELRRVYGEVDRVDLMVGMYAENPPRGLAFSDTAFRIFVLMASRRLNSDRFFTTDYTPRVYTQAGMDWIADNDMSTVLLRHYPGLAPALRGVKNAFAPWARVAA
jgi:Animal haem peroxidase